MFLNDLNQFKSFEVDFLKTPNDVLNEMIEQDVVPIDPTFVKWDAQQKKFTQLDSTSSFGELSQVCCIKLSLIHKLGTYYSEVFEEADVFCKNFASCDSWKDGEIIFINPHPLLPDESTDNRINIKFSRYQIIYRKKEVEKMKKYISELKLDILEFLVMLDLEKPTLLFPR